MKKRLLAAVAVACLAGLGTSSSVPSPDAALIQYIPVCSPRLDPLLPCVEPFVFVRPPWVPIDVWERFLAR